MNLRLFLFRSYLPAIVNRADLRAALAVIAEAAVSGALTTAQSATLTRMLIALYQAAVISATFAVASG